VLGWRAGWKCGPRAVDCRPLVQIVGTWSPEHTCCWQSCFNSATHTGWFQRSVPNFVCTLISWFSLKNVTPLRGCSVSTRARVYLHRDGTPLSFPIFSDRCWIILIATVQTVGSAEEDRLPASGIHRFEPPRSWFLKLWYAYHYWYANHCLLVRSLNKKI
jgi:hypothetical protein